MKKDYEAQCRLLRACWLLESEMRDLLVKDIVWKKDWLYLVLKDKEIEPYYPDIPGERDQLKGYERYIWMVGEEWLPVIVGQEHVFLELIEGRAPDEHVFPEVHLPPRRILEVPKRQYAASLYTMFSGHNPPVDNTPIRQDGDYRDVNTLLYDENAVYDVAHVLGYYQCMNPGFFAIRYIGQRSPRHKKKSEA